MNQKINFVSNCIRCWSSLAFVSVLLAATKTFAADDGAKADDPAYKIWQQEYIPTHDERMQWWRQGKFGMFIHWGVYSVPAGTYKGQQSKHIGEWIMRDYNIPVTEYADYTRQFDPTNFNADQWVKLAKNAGMKYIVITAKHHDGFAMFHSKVDGYNIYDATPWHHDPLAELAVACKKEGIRLGFYYSEAQDWHHPGGAAANKHPDADVDAQHHWDKAQEGSMDDYIKDVAVPQVKELLTDYGPGVPAVLWFDTPVGMTSERAEQFLPLLKLKPDLIINNRLDSHHWIGDYQTPEQKIPTNGLPGDWETCMTINSTWGYKSFDENWKSTETLICNLVDIASKGGNYLLNVGPTSTGIIPQPEVERLQQVGQWMKVNGESIYGTTASPLKSQPAWGRVTKQEDRLYLHIFDWPKDGRLEIDGLESIPQKAWLLADPDKRALKTKFIEQLDSPTAHKFLAVELPANSLDPVDTVVVLQL